MSDFLMRYGEAFSVVLFFAPAILCILVLYFTKPSWIWLSIPVTVAVDLLVWGKVIFGLPHGKVALVFLIPQVILVTVISLIIYHLQKRREDSCTT